MGRSSCLLWLITYILTIITRFLHRILKSLAYPDETKFVLIKKEIIMENDDKPIGQLLSRRDALKLLGLGSAAFLAACAAPEGTSTVLDCVVRPN